MSNKRKTSWLRHTRTQANRGLTLVEVLAGTALLGVLLVSILITRGRLVRQNRLAADRIEACQALDGLVGTWWSNRDKEPLPVTAQGYAGQWRWHTRLVDNVNAADIGGQILRVELFDGDRAGTPSAASVDLLISQHEPKNEQNDRPDAD